MLGLEDLERWKWKGYLDCGFVFIMLSRHSFAASADTDIKGLEECKHGKGKE